MHRFLNLKEKAAGAGSTFQVLETTARSQVAIMNLDPGEASSARLNRHPSQDQLLYVLEGEVTAELEGETKNLSAGEMAVLPADTPHRFVNRGEKTVRTFSIYAPPAY